MLNISGDYSSGDIAALRFGSQTMSQRIIDELVVRGKYNWHAFQAGNNVGGNWNNNTRNGTHFDVAHCTSWMMQRCNTAWVNAHAITVQMDEFHVNQSIAAFLVVRPDYAWLGWGAGAWDPVWSPAFLWDVGVPLGNCSQPSPGVFERQWTYGTARLNCHDPLGDSLVPAR